MKALFIVYLFSSIICFTEKYRFHEQHGYGINKRHFFLGCNLIALIPIVNLIFAFVFIISKFFK